MIGQHRRYICMVVIFITIVLILSIPRTSTRDLSILFLTNIVSGPSEVFRIQNKFTCPFRADRWIVLTTIFYPTLAVEKFLQLNSSWSLVVIADRKTPEDWLRKVKGNRSRLIFLSLTEQYSLDYSILKYLPEGSYARKNLGYLIAIQCGAQIIFESDDDNLLDTNDIYHLPKSVSQDLVPWVAFHRQRSAFVNIYASFGHPEIWPRGFPIAELRNVTEDGWHSVRRNDQNQTRVYIQQYLADLDPDVDALYRLTHPLSIGRIRFDRQQAPIVLERGTYSPYNTQNTITHSEAFWGLLLPMTTTFRVCDIWRSFWVQRLLWDIGGQVMFGTATVKQIRNSHSYLQDMIEEEQLYHQSSAFVRFLSSWSSSLPSLDQRISQLTEEIVRAGFLKAKDLDLTKAWLKDLQAIGYVFPSIVPESTRSHPVQERRAAICVTGFIECIQEAWVPNHRHIRNSLRGDVDTFLFLSSSSSSGPVPLSLRAQQARAYLNTTVTILYEDRLIDPQIPSNCSSEFIVPRHAYKIDAYFQQLWALNQCYQLVSEYQKRFNIKYQLMIRTRVDILSPKPFQLERGGRHDIDRALLAPPNRFFQALDDGFAVGPMNLMFHYMTRWDSLNQCPPDRIYHSEIHLTRHLQRFTQVTRDRTLPAAANALPHGRDKCH